MTPLTTRILVATAAAAIAVVLNFGIFASTTPQNITFPLVVQYVRLEATDASILKAVANSPEKLSLTAAQCRLLEKVGASKTLIAALKQQCPPVVTQCPEEINQTAVRETTDTAI